jgi:hypothetical protein
VSRTCPWVFLAFNRVVSDEILRCTDLAAAIQMAKANGMTTREIVRELTRGMSYSDALRLARRAAPLLDIGVSEFMQLRRNECGSSPFEFGEKAITVAADSTKLPRLRRFGSRGWRASRLKKPGGATRVLFYRANQTVRIEITCGGF